MATALDSGLRKAMRAVIGTNTRRAAEAYELRDVDDAEKEDQREKVFGHLCQANRVRLLSLPDEKWTFERLVDSRKIESRFIGIQWSWMHVERGCPWMPGESVPTYFADRNKCGQFAGYETNRARIVFGHASGFMGLTATEMFGRGCKGTRKAFSAQYRTSNAVWLDFTSQLCTEIEGACRRLHAFLDADVESVPVCISFMAARDDFQHDKDRVSQLLNWLNSARKYRIFKLSERWAHQSAETPFITVALDARKGRRWESIAQARASS